MVPESFWELNVGARVNIVPSVDRRALGGAPNVIPGSDYFENHIVLLRDGQGKTVVNLSSTNIRFHDESGPITAVEDREFWILRIQRKYGIVVHRQSMHTTAGRQTPDLDSLIRASRHHGVARAAEQDRPHIASVATEFRDSLSCPGIPKMQYRLRPAVGQDVFCCT